MLGENRDVLAPFAQWRQPERQYIKPEVEIGAKLSILEALRHVPVACGYQPGSDRG